MIETAKYMICKTEVSMFFNKANYNSVKVRCTYKTFASYQHVVV